MKSLKSILEGVVVSSDVKLVPAVNAQGKPTTRKVRAHRKSISPTKDDSEEKQDVVSNIQKFVNRQYNTNEEAAKPKTSPIKDYTGVDVDSGSAPPKGAKLNIKTIEPGSAIKVTPEKPAKPPVKEETEQIDELKKSTLGSYVKKAARDMSASRKIAADFENQAGRAKSPSMKGASNRLADKFNAISKKRNAGIGKAVERLTKEEVEQIDEISKELTHSYFKKAYAQKYKNEPTKPTKLQMKNRDKGMSKATNRLMNRLELPKGTDPSEGGKYTADSFELEGDMIDEAKSRRKSVEVRWFEAIQKAKQQRETEEARKKENEKRALAPRQTNEAKDDDEDYSKHHKLDPDSGVEADQHIHVQLKKAIDSTMKPYEVTFKNGKKHSVSSPVAKTIVTAIEKLKPEHRKQVHDELHKSYDSLMSVHKAIVGGK